MAGLPGSGKSTLAEGLSRHFSLPLFSVDPIEAAMWRGGLPRDQTGIAAYVVAQTLAEADRPGSPNQRRSERGPRPLRLWILALGFARHRRDLERGDAVALTPQHAEAETVEGKTLAALGDRARFVNH